MRRLGLEPPARRMLILLLATSLSEKFVDVFVHSLAADTVDVAILDAEVVLEAEVRSGILKPSWWC